MRKILTAVLVLLSLQSFSQLTIGGTVWYDADYNHVYNSNELPLVNKIIKLQQVGSQLTYYVQTGGDGYFSKDVVPGDYLVSFFDSYDSVNYRPAATVEVFDQGGGYEYADIAFQPKRAPTYVGASLYSHDFISSLPPGGSSQQLVLMYGYTDISIMSMPVKVTLDFNPMITLTGASVTPTVSVPGHAEWNFSSLDASESYPFNNPGDTILCSFNFPPAGDTIESFEIAPALVPQIAVDTISTMFQQSTFLFNQWQHTPVGVSSGVKWMYSLNRSGADYDLPYFGKCIDTAYSGDGYFIVAGNVEIDSFSNSIYNTSISKAGKDGLLIWEKKISSADLNGINMEPATITAMPDGGCTVFGTMRRIDSVDRYWNATCAFRIDSAGNILWQNVYPAYAGEDVYHSVNTSDGGFLVTGYAASNVAVPGSINGDSVQIGNLFIEKIAANGTAQWRKEYGGSREDAGLKIVALNNGTYLVLGGTTSNDGDVVGSHMNGQGNTNPDSNFIIEGWILNIDGNGNLLWNRCYGGTGNGYFTDAVQSGNSILLAGFTSSKDGDLPYYPESGIPLWLLNISNTGTINWSKYYKYYAGYKDTAYLNSPVSSLEEPAFRNISKTSDGNFVLAGSLFDSYGVLRSKHGREDFTFIKIDPAGNLIWQKSVGGTSYESISAAMADKNGDIVFAGESESQDDDLYGRTATGQYYTKVIGKIGVTNLIKGQVFIDNNGNNIKDAGEILYSNGHVQSIKANDTLTGYIFNGQYLNNADTGNYSTSYIPVNNYYTISPAVHNSNFASLDQTDIVDFVLRPRPGINDLEIQVIPLNPARPGFECYYRIITRNIGTSIINNAVTALKKDSRQSYVSSSRPYSGITGDSLWWGPVALDPFEADTIDVILLNAAPTTLNNGDTILLQATANPLINDSSAANNHSNLLQPVRGSFDPNDKSELHGGQLTPLAYSNNEYLQYLVRFQNTGSDTAFFITVKDTLDPKLDLRSLEVISASHSYDFKQDKNIATWQFRFIGLPDSLTNEAASHGYLLFKIKPVAGLGIGSSFSNRASIYFDFNLPVLTNNEKTTIGDGSGICPGGNVKYNSSITGSSYQWQVNTGSGYTNISNNATYSGATTSALQLTAASTTMYGYKYRCLVNGNSYSAESQLKFIVSWTGAGDTNWQNAANWNCGVLPDANTDVILKTGAPNYPVVNNSVSCRSIKATGVVSLLVKAGVQLNLTGR